MARRGSATLRPRRRARLRHWWRVLVVMAVLATALIVTGALTGLLVPAIVTSAAFVLAWTAFLLRPRRRVPQGGSGGGGRPGPQGGGVREPRRPLPMSPAGAAALPIPEDS
jgi:hypothetical protein